jgi:hypothetical protein
VQQGGDSAAFSSSFRLDLQHPVEDPTRNSRRRDKERNIGARNSTMKSHVKRDQNAVERKIFFPARLFLSLPILPALCSLALSHSFWRSRSSAASSVRAKAPQSVQIFSSPGARKSDREFRLESLEAYSGYLPSRIHLRPFRSRVTFFFSLSLFLLQHKNHYSIVLILAIYHRLKIPPRCSRIVEERSC